MKVAVIGGHFSPALSVIQLLLRRGDSVVVLGRKYTFEGEEGISFEYSVCEKLNIPFYSLRASRLQRKFTKHTLPSLVKFPQGIGDAINILRKENPDIILSFGGYLSLPVIFAASLQQIPIIIHEQTQAAGIANKIAARFAAKVLITFDSSRVYFPPAKTILTGNPIRKEIFSVQKKITIPSGKKVLYVTGGSGGSHFLNVLIEHALSDMVSKYVVIHQTGDAKEFNDFDRLEKLREALPGDMKKNYILKKFIYPEEVGYVFSKTDLVISRSGINTTLEIMALKKKALLFPLPHGQHGEQLENAKLIQKNGLGSYLLQKDVNTEIFLREIENELHKKITYKNSIVLDADQRIVNILDSMYVQEEKNPDRE